MKIEPIARQFFDFKHLVSDSPFGTGHINDTHKIVIAEEGYTSDNQRSFILQRLNHQVFRQPEAVMHNLRLVAAHLSRQPYPLRILSPVPTKSLQWLYPDKEGNFWRAFPFFENTVSFDRVETEEQAFGAAKAFGAFSKALGNMSPKPLKITIPGFHDGMERLQYFIKAIQTALPDRLALARAEAEEILQNQLIFNKIASLPLPRRVVHHDTKINNVLFDAITGDPAAVIDLDTVMPGIVLSDFGDMMRTFTSPSDEDESDLSKVEMRLPVFRALSEGFLSEMSDTLAPVEKAHLAEGGRWLTLMQAMRFLTDFLKGDVYYKVKHPAHNFQRAKNQLALFRSMSAQIRKA